MGRAHARRAQRAESVHAERLERAQRAESVHGERAERAQRAESVPGQADLGVESTSTSRRPTRMEQPAQMFPVTFTRARAQAEASMDRAESSQSSYRPRRMLNATSHSSQDAEAELGSVTGEGEGMAEGVDAVEEGGSISLRAARLGLTVARAPERSPRKRNLSETRTVSGSSTGSSGSGGSGSGGSMSDASAAVPSVAGRD